MMKDERWFETIASGYTLVDKKTILGDFRRIYTQGRADQNEADVKAFVVAGRKHHEFIHPDIAVDLYGAILAAGPEVKE
jgi:hypothetical protein